MVFKSRYERFEHKRKVMKELITVCLGDKGTEKDISRERMNEKVVEKIFGCKVWFLYEESSRQVVFKEEWKVKCRTKPSKYHIFLKQKVALYPFNDILATGSYEGESALIAVNVPSELKDEDFANYLKFGIWEKEKLDNLLITEQISRKSKLSENMKGLEEKGNVESLERMKQKMKSISKVLERKQSVCLNFEFLCRPLEDDAEESGVRTLVVVVTGSCLTLGRKKFLYKEILSFDNWVNVKCCRGSLDATEFHMVNSVDEDMDRIQGTELIRFYRIPFNQGFNQDETFFEKGLFGVNGREKGLLIDFERKKICFPKFFLEKEGDIFVNFCLLKTNNMSLMNTFYIPRDNNLNKEVAQSSGEKELKKDSVSEEVLDEKASLFDTFEVDVSPYNICKEVNFMQSRKQFSKINFSVASNCLEGSGEIIFGDGSKFLGSIKNGRISGQGIWKNFSYLGSEFSAGFFIDGVLSGFGVKLMFDLIEVGNFKDGGVDGYGYRLSPNFLHSGYFERSKLTGKGTSLYMDNTESWHHMYIFEGLMVEDEILGDGKLYLVEEHLISMNLHSFYSAAVTAFERMPVEDLLPYFEALGTKIKELLSKSCQVAETVISGMWTLGKLRSARCVSSTSGHFMLTLNKNIRDLIRKFETSYSAAKAHKEQLVEKILEACSRRRELKTRNTKRVCRRMEQGHKLFEDLSGKLDQINMLVKSERSLTEEERKQVSFKDVKITLLACILYPPPRRSTINESLRHYLVMEKKLEASKMVE
eukprot:snap_masked-scaffold_47-processed-gene-0.13-mRNA-1 protein AED:1.00 eAED:1.00 QI:0/-1/0/0/-1/1/1/0/760